MYASEYLQAGGAAAPNGEVEGPADHASQRPRARNIDWVPRPQTTGASRPPPTIVRRHASTSDPKVFPLERTRSGELSAAPGMWTSTRHGARAGASPQDYAEAQRTPPLLSGDDVLQRPERRCA